MLFSFQGTVYATCTPSKSRGQLSGLKPAMPFQAMPQDLTKAKGHGKLLFVSTVYVICFHSFLNFNYVYTEYCTSIHLFKKDLQVSLVLKCFDF